MALDNKIHLPYVEFYITNACNFNCNGCNRFNNYAFAGSQRWTDYQEVYTKWSNLIEFDSCTILGGEPMAMVDYIDWLDGIRKLWPTTKIEFLTNGSLLKPDNRKLYNTIMQSASNTILAIGLHNKGRLTEVLETVTAWLVGEVKITRFPEHLEDIENSLVNWQNTYNNIRADSWPECNHWSQWEHLPQEIKEECSQLFNFTPEKFVLQLQNYQLVDSQGVCVTISWEDNFHQGALIPDISSNSFKLHKSDPIKAHSICHSKTCHHFDSGKLYKCGQVALFPKFNEQFVMDLTPEEIGIIHSYSPGHVDMTHDELANWSSKLSDPIPQCQFCPESYCMSEIVATTKKISFKKRKKNELR